MDTVKLSKKLNECLNDIIKCHKNKESITYNYVSLNKSFDELMVCDIGNIYKVQRGDECYFFILTIADNSGWRDCDIRYTYTPIEHKTIYSFEEVKMLLTKLNNDLIGDDVKSLRNFEKWMTKNLL